MNDINNIFELFCEYVDHIIFPEEKIGSSVSFVIDQVFIDSFCKQYEFEPQNLIEAVGNHIFEANPSILHIKGLLAMQLLAASQRENSDGITEANYRDRLSKLLNWDINGLQRWMESHQDEYWHTLYKWCDDNYFEITKCYPKSGAGRYVQYPIQQATRVFTIEDLKYIAAAFVEDNLHPFEHISEKDFWHTLHWSTLRKKAHTKHSQDILTNDEFRKDAKRQIYNFFNYWQGEYKIREKVNTLKAEEERVILLNKKLVSLEIRDNHLNLKQRIDLENLSYETYKKYCPIRRAGLVIMKPFDIYDDYYIETRYLEQGEDGLAIFFKEHCTHPIKDHIWDQIKDFKFLKLFNVKYENDITDLFLHNESFKLIGGLKIGRLQYLEGGGPLLQLDKPKTLWINGEKITNENPVLNLKNLPLGSNTIKILGERKIELEICSDSAKETIWSDNHNKWVLDKYGPDWCNFLSDKGAVGLDFSDYASTNKDDSNTPILETWAKAMHEIDASSKNYIIRNLKNIISHE